MADNFVVYGGTAGTAITGAADEVVIYGATALIQGIKIHDGTEGGTVGAKVTSDGLYVFQSNAGTVAGTVTVANASFPVTGSVSVANQGTVVGTVTVANATLAVTQSTSPWVTAGTVTTVPSGTAATKEVRAATSAITGVASTTAGQTLLASNANRLGATVFNSSTAILYVALGGSAGVTPATYSFQMFASDYYETPFGYTGALSGVWGAANGSALVNELTV